MAFLAGIDEAGYGPFVGPLVHGYSLFRVPDFDIELWDALKVSCARKPERSDKRRLWVNDSKKVHQGTLGRGRLERSVATFRQLLNNKTCLDSWLAEKPTSSPKDLHHAPWYQDLEIPFCPSTTIERSKLDAASVQRDLYNAGCNLNAFGARVVPAHEYNRMLNDLGNKGSTNFEVAMQCARHIIKITGDAPLRIELDQHGGRSDYKQMLSDALNPQSIDVHGENNGGSTYSLHFGTRTVQVRFSSGADLEHFTVALASLAAKQSRERIMDCFNQYWCEQFPDLKPTKGYGVDGKRWLADIEPHLDDLQIDRAILRRKR
ncbi:MAG: ribonuclease HII [Myxococcota bacterium]|jgi:ribonuclease HII